MTSERLGSSFAAISPFQEAHNGPAYFLVGLVGFVGGLPQFSFPIRERKCGESPVTCIFKCLKEWLGEYYPDGFSQDDVDIVKTLDIPNHLAFNGYAIGFRVTREIVVEAVPPRATMNMAFLSLQQIMDLAKRGMVTPGMEIILQDPKLPDMLALKRATT